MEWLKNENDLGINALIYPIWIAHLYIGNKCTKFLAKKGGAIGNIGLMGSGGDEIVLKSIAKSILIASKPFRLTKFRLTNLFLGIRGSKFGVLF